MTTKTMKRALVASLSAAAVLATAACSSTPAAPGTSGSTGGGASTANWDEKGPITYVQDKDTSGNLKAEIDEWNAANPNEQVSFIELSDSADQQRDAMIQRSRANSDEFTIMSVDVVWTTEFAANGWLEELPADKFPLDGFLQGAVDSATYFDKVWAYPSTSDGGMLYYRVDLVDEPPTTWADMKRICDEVLPSQPGMSCYAGQHQKYEGLTVNIAEAINSAGGDIIGADGQPAV
ncbi:MAG: extracellular solute-binding protein, partial [Actinomycetes bacterium]